MGHMFHPFFVFICMKIKRACVISGGGSWGAYGGGTLERINNEYDTVVGVSSGALLAPLTALNEWYLLKSAYTNVDENSILDSCWYKGKPLTKNGRLRKLPVLMTLLLGQESICTSKELRKTINYFFTEYQFNELRKKRKEIIVGTQNFAQIPSRIHYFSSMETEYEDFKDWMWCSANFPFLTSLVRKGWSDDNGNFHVGLWGDGALTGLIGLNQLIMGGYNEIDIIMHRRKNVGTFEGNKVNNLIDNVKCSMHALRCDADSQYFYEKIKKLNKQGATVRIFWLPRRLGDNSMVFNKEEMGRWWNEGYETAFDTERIEIHESTKKRF